MVHLKTSVLLVLLISCTVDLKAGDFSQWWHSTPGNNKIANESWNDMHRTMVICRKDHSRIIEFIDKWYFHKGYVIGILDSNQVNKFFIVNERACTVETFIQYAQFESALTQKELQPLLWTRWYQANWGFFITGPGYSGYWDFFFFRATTPLLILVLLSTALFLRILRRHRWAWIISFIILAAIMLRFLLDNFPQSI